MTAHNPDWRSDALCAEVAGDIIWFPPKGASVTAARTICGQCAVRSECLTDALLDGEQQEVRAGMTERERRQMKQAVGIAIAAKGAA